MRRREFLGVLSGAAAAYPMVSRAQPQPTGVRRIGALTGGAIANNAEGQARLAAFQRGLLQLGWAEGQNVRIDYR
jgi:putative ABC transport system substrate-binding protein